MAGTTPAWQSAHATKGMLVQMHLAVYLVYPVYILVKIVIIVWIVEIVYLGREQRAKSEGLISSVWFQQNINPLDWK